MQQSQWLVLSLLSISLFSTRSSAAYCAVQSYVGADGGENSCTGASLTSGHQSGAGTSACTAAENAHCLEVTDESNSGDGSDCVVDLFLAADCSGSPVRSVECHDEPVEQTTFNSFRIECLDQ